MIDYFDWYTDDFDIIDYPHMTVTFAWTEPDEDGVKYINIKSMVVDSVDIYDWLHDGAKEQLADDINNPKSIDK